MLAFEVMMENYKRWFVSSAEEDRISNLPEHLVVTILELLPIQDAVRTSIISKTWRYKWTTMRALSFNQDFSDEIAKNGAFGRNGFIRIVNKVLILHKGPISKFHLHIPSMSLDSFQEVDQFMLLLSRNGVTELILNNSNRQYELPSYLFSCLELTKLKLDNCFFKPPLEFKGFINLKDLYIENIDFRSNLCGTQINLPQLTKLCMYFCTNVQNFNFKATKLYHLSITTYPDAMLLRLLRSPCVTVLGIYLWKPVEDNVGVERITSAMMLSNLTKIEAFVIDGHFLKFITAENNPKWLAHPISSLKRLWFHEFQLGDLDQLHGALCLLRNTPNLIILRMVHLEMEPRVDIGSASNYLESPNCLDCALNRLETVKITCLEGSRPELLFIKLLLAHSPSLEKVTISPNETFDAQKRLNIAEDVMQFPRASTKAKIFYLNPKP